MAFPSTVKFSRLKERNPEYQADYWRRCRVLYEGGPALLENQDALREVLPQHHREEPDVYKERLSRAYYIPYAGSIIDKLIAELGNKPLTVEREQEGESQGAQLDEFYQAFCQDTSMPGGKACSINQLAREQVLTAMQCGLAWALVDMPPMRAEGYANRAEQEQAGALRVYVCLIEPERVIDWECNESGALTFAIVKEVVNRRTGIDGDRDLVTLRYRYWTATEWAVYVITYSKKQKPNGPADEEEVKLEAQGAHSFGRVPLVPLCLPPGLWAMGKLEAMARAHLNQRCALSWGQLRSLFAQAVLYAQRPDPMDPVSEDENRGQQPMGAGNLWVLAEKDRLEFPAPDPAPYDHVAKDLTVLRDEMYRVLHSMAMSVDNTGAALRRSAESKSVDQAAGAVILRALGQLVREHLLEILQTVATGRGEEIKFSITGMDNFDDTSLSQLVVDAVGIEQLAIPSATFKRHWLMKLAKLALGADATEEQLEEISDELEEALTQDMLTMPGMPGMPPAPPEPRRLPGAPGERGPAEKGPSA